MHLDSIDFRHLYKPVNLNKLRITMENMGCEQGLRARMDSTTGPRESRGRPGGPRGQVGSGHVKNTTRIALHKLPAKSSLNVRSVCPVCPLS